jgi:two-component system sensor histidine kinase KdpD
MDGTLIAQVLINLLENAIKHSPSTASVEVTLKKSGNLAVFEVVDHGKGISDEDFPYLFTSYVPNGNKSPDSSGEWNRAVHLHDYHKSA